MPPRIPEAQGDAPPGDSRQRTARRASGRGASPRGPTVPSVARPAAPTSRVPQPQPGARERSAGTGASPSAPQSGSAASATPAAVAVPGPGQPARATIRSIERPRSGPSRDGPDLPAPEQVGIVTRAEQQQREDGIGQAVPPRRRSATARIAPAERSQGQVLQNIPARKLLPLRWRGQAGSAAAAGRGARCAGTKAIRALRTLPGDHRDDVEVIADRHVRPEPGDQAQVERDHDRPRDPPDENPGPRLHAVDGGRDHRGRFVGSCGTCRSD